MLAATARAGGPDAGSGDELIVKFRDAGAGGSVASTLTERVDRLRRDIDTRLRHRRALATGAHALGLSEQVSPAVVERIVERLNAHPEVRYAVRNRVHRAQFVPNDAQYANQWYLFEDTGGMRVQRAWDRTRGDPGVVVAVLDTGELPHRDLAGARMLDGYDFISDPFIANDGDARDADESDPGDWVTDPESTSQPQCSGQSEQDSSWHGTEVTGFIGAVVDNARDIAGIDHRTSILPVRVLGKCGGFLVDIIDAIVWAAGGRVPGVPDNGHPADIVNLSLSGNGSCGPAMQDAIDQARARGTVIVASAGNGDGDVANHTPASCQGVVTVAATDRGGSRAPYSNNGEAVDVSAPGGTASSALITISNDGRKGPGVDALSLVVGTSFATANVTGVVSLILSVRSDLQPDEVTDILRKSARPFPGTGCENDQCGAGLVDADTALRTAAGAESSSESGGDTGGGGAWGASGLLVMLAAALARCPGRARTGQP